MIQLPFKKMFLRMVAQAIKRHADKMKTTVNDVQAVFALKTEMFLFNPADSEEFVRQSELDAYIEERKKTEPDYEDPRLLWMEVGPVADTKYLICQKWYVKEKEENGDIVKTTVQCTRFLDFISAPVDVNKWEGLLAPMANQFLNILSEKENINPDSIKIVCGLKGIYRNETIRNLEGSMIGLYLFNDKGPVRSLDFDDLMELLQEQMMNMQEQQEQ